MSPKELGNLLLRDFALRCLQQEFYKRFVGCFDGVIVDLQKQPRRFQSNSFVAVEKWIVLDEMKRISGDHLESVGVEVLAFKHSLGLRHR